VSKKREQTAQAISKINADKALITAPASIAWLLNIRGADVMCTPLALSTAIIASDGSVDLFIHPDKITDEVRQHLGNHVSLHHEDEISKHFNTLKGVSIIVDPNVTSDWYVQTLKSAGATIISAADPVALPKACKNKAEITATTQAHKRDGAVLIEFLHWLDTTAQSG